MIVQSSAPPDKGDGYGFRNWKYATIRATIAYLGAMEDLCLDTGYTMSLVDRKWLHALKPDAVIRRTTNSVTVRGIGDRQHSSSDYATLDLYVEGKVKGKTAIAHIRRDVHIVDNLKAKMLIGTDIMCPEGMIASLQTGKLTIGSCDMTAPITCTPAGPRINRTVRSHHAVTLPAHSVVPVPFKSQGSAIPSGRDYSFQPHTTSLDFGAEGGIMAHVMDAQTSVIHVRNAMDKPILVPKHTKLGRITDFEEEGCYHADVSDAHLAVGVSWKRRALTAIAGLAMAAAPLLAGMTSASPAISLPQTPEAFATAVAAPLEITTPTGITIYGATPETQSKLQETAEAFPNIWRDSGGTVNIPEEDWMPINTLPGTKPDPPRVYPVGLQDREFIDKEFDKLHQEGKLSWTTEATPYGFPVFVVWRTIHMPGQDPIRKGRTVIDIRGLNKVAVPDGYPMPLQSDVTSSVSGCPYVSVMDAAGFFHQWLVKVADRHKLTVVSHRGSEQFNVAVMGYTGLPAYVQRQIDGILREFRAFARAYVDDIVVFSKTLEEHLEHLRSIFQLFQKMNIALKPSKTYLGYPTVALLGQKVESLGLTTAEEKLEAISKLRFPATLKLLETYLGLTGWMRNYVPYYAQLSNPLQIRKTLLLKNLPVKGAARKRYSSGTRLDIPTESERSSYQAIQEVFSKPTFLVHHDRTRQLYADVDASHERGFGGTVFHVKGDKEVFAKEDIEPILFLRF